MSKLDDVVIAQKGLSWKVLLDRPKGVLHLELFLDGHQEGTTVDLALTMDECIAVAALALSGNVQTSPNPSQPIS